MSEQEILDNIKWGVIVDGFEALNVDGFGCAFVGQKLKRSEKKGGYNVMYIAVFYVDENDNPAFIYKPVVYKGNKYSNKQYDESISELKRLYGCRKNQK